MLSEFEQRLAAVLGSRLPAPFTNRGVVAPAEIPAGADAGISLGVARAELVRPDIGCRRPEPAPGADDPRRVLRLDCSVELEVRPGPAAVGPSRGSRVACLDAAVYAVDAPDLRNGSALSTEGDPGFLIQELRLSDLSAPLAPDGADDGPVRFAIAAAGWFWPVGEAGITGAQIGQIRLRGAFLPISVEPRQPRAVAGGGPLTLTVRFGASGTARLTGGAPLTADPFGTVALALVASGGGVAAGSLSGGAEGVAGARLLQLTGGAVRVDYQPPAEPATDELVVALENGAGGLGVELGRMPLPVQGA